MAAGEVGGDGGGGTTTTRSLLETPTWAVATVCFVFISLGIFIEYLIHVAAHWLKKHKKASLYEAIEKLKTVLMQLGFMSLILTVTQKSISKICIPNKVADSMLPCRRLPETITGKVIGRLLISTGGGMTPHGRALAAAASAAPDHCASKGMTSLMSQEGINQLNIFIFVLAAMQIICSVATMGLGRAKMKTWKTWESETQSVEYMAANDPQRFRLARQTTFGRRHVNSCATNSTQLWIICFFRQFFHSVAKIDYFTLRHGFISAHLPANGSFNFQKYIQRSLEDDFKAVVGISPIMWLVVVLFLLVDVHGWNAYLWVSFVPLIIVLFIGTKLEVVVARMAMKITDEGVVIKGAPLVQPNDDFFWFARPQLVLTLLHFTLFMNAFETSFAIWVTWQFGIKSCYHDNIEIIIIRVALAITIQFICSYITLPLYALVTQMGSQYKSAILEDHTIHAIKQWHKNVKQKRKMEPPTQSSTTHVGENSSITRSSSSVSTSPDESSHRRTPTFSEFASHSHTDHHITQEIENDDDNHVNHLA